MTKGTTATVIGSVLVLVSVASCDLRSRGPSNPAAAEAEIREHARTWAQVAVTGDPIPMERIFADDFLGTNPEGRRYTKREFIDDAKANPLGFVSNVVNEVTVRFFDDVAIAQGDETFTSKTGSQGRFVWTDVYVSRDGRWQSIAAQDVVVPVTDQAGGGALFQEPDPDARREIERTRAAYVAAWQAGDASRIAELYADDGVVLYPNQPAVTGRKAIVEYFRNFFNDFPKNEFALTSTEVVVNGQWAFDRGTYRWKGVPKSGGRPEQDNGKYLVVLQRQADGAWKVARDMDNSDLPASQADRAR